MTASICIESKTKNHFAPMTPKSFAEMKPNRKYCSSGSLSPNKVICTNFLFELCKSVIKLAKKHPNAQVMGIDYWGKRWEYSKSMCERNAEAEGVSEQAKFQKASAVALPFDDGYFDAAISNFVFHEVSDAKDKREVIREALRVVKKGGKFSFQDEFLVKQFYGETDDLVKTIKSWGIAKVEFVKTRDAEFIPQALKLPFILGSIGIIKGEK